MGQPLHDPGKDDCGAFDAKHLNASEAAASPPDEPVVRRCACGALACYGQGLGETVWYCADCVPDEFWDHKRRAESEAVVAAPRPAVPARSRPKQGSLKL